MFLADRSDAGHALIDRSLYLPKEWVNDQTRRTEGKIPESVTFSTKPALAREMLKRIFAVGVLAKWGTADEVYSEPVQQFSKKQRGRLSCGSVQKGERLYDWAYVSWPSPDDDNCTRGFLVRRSLSDPDDISYFFTNASKRTTLNTIVRIAGSRWAIEEYSTSG